MSGILAIDTASPAGIALAFAADGAIATCSIEGAQEHSQQLLAAIDGLIKARPDRIGSIGVATGPGSYAGLRVGIATAESLGMGLGVPVFGFGTFVAIAAGTQGLADFVAIHPAGRGEWAILPFRHGAAAGSPTIVAATELRPDVTFAGEGAEAFGGVEITREARSRTIARLTADSFVAGERPRGLEAFYLREPNITRPKRAALASTGP